MIAPDDIRRDRAARELLRRLDVADRVRDDDWTPDPGASIVRVLASIGVSHYRLEPWEQAAIRLALWVAYPLEWDVRLGELATLDRAWLDLVSALLRALWSPDRTLLDIWLAACADTRTASERDA